MALSRGGRDFSIPLDILAARLKGRAAKADKHTSGLPGNFAAIVRFGPALEPLQPILHASLEQLAAKFFEDPTPPTWRECEVSAKLYATGSGVERDAGDGWLVDDAQWKRDV